MENKKTNIRINKYLSDAGICSRREADKIVAAGKVFIDGQVAQVGSVVHTGQKVTLGKKTIEPKDRIVVLAVNKPRGIVCTAEKKERHNIHRLLKYPQRITYAGRLDKNSRGLLLMTNDGDLINQLMRAKHFHEKEYQVKVDKEITTDFMEKMSQGVEILDTITRPCQLKKLGKYTFQIILSQGLNRQIRRMCQALGYEVKDLLRTRIVTVELGNLSEGSYRELGEEEILSLREAIQRDGK